MKIAYESLINHSFASSINHVYRRINLSHKDSVNDFIKNPLHKNSLPILSYPDISDIETVISSHEKALETLINAGYITTIAIDDSSSLLEYFSHRNEIDFLDKCQYVREFFTTFSHNMSVILTTEELMPKGIDAYESVMIANFLVSCGINKIIATCGSKKFPLLYERRKTTPKNQELDTCEPKVAAGIWLKEHTSINIGIYVNYIDEEHEKYVIKQSKKLNYCEVIFNR